MLIEGYDLEIVTPPCDPGTESWSAMAHLRVDIGEVFEYAGEWYPEVMVFVSCAGC